MIMGWRKFKDHFQIEHYVRIQGECLLIGSAHVSDLATIELKSGKLQQNENFPRFLNEKYPKLLEVSSAEILELLNTEDQFCASIPVYTYDGAEIIEKFCEVFGWPNVTHDGDMMYENTFFTDKSKAVLRAKTNAQCGIENYSERITETEIKLAELKERLAEYQADLKKLEAL